MSLPLTGRESPAWSKDHKAMGSAQSSSVHQNQREMPGKPTFCTIFPILFQPNPIVKYYKIEITK